MALSKILPASQDQYVGARNLIINGGMTVSQRGTTFASTANVAYTLDRFQWFDTGAGVVDISQSTDTPNDNFKNSLKVDVTTADSSLAAGDLYNIIHKIEGYNIAHLGWGTSDAKTVTLSFHIKSPKTGTHCVTLRNSDQTRTRVEEFTINSADTWEKKNITITGDTSGTWQSTTSAGIQLIFPLAAGSTYHSSVAAGSWGNGGNIYASSNQVNCMDSDANNWYITGIQLEVGETATPFEHEDYGTTLAKCMRYYQLVDNGIGKVTGLNNNVQMLIKAAFDMRATPSMSVTTLRVTDCTASDYADSTVTVGGGNINLRGGRTTLGMSSTAAVGTVVMLLGTGSSAAPVQLSAEL